MQSSQNSNKNANSNNHVEYGGSGNTKTKTARNAKETGQDSSSQQQQQRLSSPSASSSASATSFDSVSTFTLEDDIKAKIKVGEDYQVDLTPYNLKLYKDDDRSKLPEKAVLVWRPSNKISDRQLDQYLNEVMHEKSYNIEQAIGLLNHCDHDINKALLMSNKFRPRSDEWTKEEKIMFEHGYWFHGKNFNKIKFLLPHKSQASLVKYYYTWKKTRMQKSLMDYQMDLKAVNIGDQNGGNSSSKDVENGVAYEELDLTEKSDDNDSIDDHFNSNVNKICCNCDLITPDLQSTPKGMLCNLCYAFWKDSGGLMRPDQPISTKSMPSSSGAASVSGQSHGYLQNSAFRTNRFLTITNNDNGTMTSSQAISTSSDATGAGGGTLMSKDAKNFQKSLRKPPKGIYLNYDELVELVQGDTNKVFGQLNRRISALKIQAQKNKQEIHDLIRKATEKEEEIFRSEINDMLSEIEDRLTVKTTIGWTRKEVLYALRTFSKYGNKFDIISLVIPTKPESSIRAFYYYYKDIYNLDKLILNSEELEKIADDIHKEVNEKVKPVIVEEKS